jgi:cell division protein ZapA (FtsZ GTPase activity inhibitor)
MRTIEVEIFNTRFTVRESENEAYLHSLAAEVDARIQQMCASAPRISPLRAAIMVAYAFADEAKRQQVQKLTEKV